MRILLVEDDVALGAAVREQIMAEGQACDWVDDLASAAAAAAAVPYDLLLLDVGLPDGSGLVYLRGLRAAGGGVPVILLTARDRIADRVEGLNAGADDYLVKPFDLAELSARIAAVTRRISGNPSPVVIRGGIEIDRARRMVQREGCPVDLTAREWAILDHLLRHPDVTVPRARLEEAIYGFGAEVESNAVEAHVSRLRRKLGPTIIETRRGIGYRLGPA